MKFPGSRETGTADRVKANAHELATSNEQIAARWCEIADEHPTEEVTTSEGVKLIVFRMPNPARDKVQYEAYLPEHARARETEVSVARLYPRFRTLGRIQITDAKVAHFEGFDYRGKGVGPLLYDLIESDLQKSGGVRIEPEFGNMSSNAKAFWRKRRPSLDIELPGWDADGYEPPREYWGAGGKAASK